MNKTQKKDIHKKLLNEIKNTQKKITEYTVLCKPIALKIQLGGFHAWML